MATQAINYGPTDLLTSPVDVLDDFIIGAYENKTVEVTIASGQNLVRGTAMAKQTSDGKYYELNQGAEDGTETLVGFLNDDIDATDADTLAYIIVTGVFDKNGITATSPIDTGLYNYGNIIVKESA